MARTSSQADWVRTALRLPAELHKSMHAVAGSEDRTFNAQIVAMLREGVAARLEKEAQHEKHAASTSISSSIQRS